MEAVNILKPDVITLDVEMPKMDGLEAARQIMEKCPTPIVIVSASYSVKDVNKAMKALEVGALAIVPKPYGIRHPEHEASVRTLVKTVKLMAGVQVIRRYSYPRKASASVIPSVRLPHNIDIIAVGGSTGATNVLQTILSGLPRDFPVPILIVQHMAAGFIGGFSIWLNDSTGFPTSVALNGEFILPGHAYVAQEMLHMGVDANKRIIYTKSNPENGAIPSVSFLFRSVTHVYGGNAAGVLLSGMGRDGAEELKIMRSEGAFTIAQDKESCVVFGMPGVAMELDAAEIALPPEQIAATLMEIAHSTHQRR